MLRRRLLSLLSLALSLSSLMAQTPTPPLPAESSQFDFWIGVWDVTEPNGKPAGVSRIERVDGGRGLLETWKGASGSEGRSMNAYNESKKRWQQYWVGGGGVLELEGGLDEHGRMVLSDRDTRAHGQKLINRVIWTPNADGTVRQHWETSEDDGVTWKTSFDGLYRRQSTP